MDSSELARIVATLERAIASARAAIGDDDEDVGEAVRHAREMHAILVEALGANPALSTERMRGVVEATGNAAAELEAEVARGAGQVH